MYENAREEDLALLFRVLNEHLTDEQEAQALHFEEKLRGRALREQERQKLEWLMDEVTLQNYGKGKEVR